MAPPKQSIFDAHAHFLSYSFMESLGSLAGMKDAAGQRVCEKLGWDLPPRDPVMLGRQWIAELDAKGVDRSVMFHTQPGDPQHVAAAVRPFAHRLVGYLMVNPTEPSAIRITSKAVNEWGFRGITLFPAMHRFDLASDSVSNLFQFANEHKLVVFVHCGVLKVGFRRILGMPCDFDLTKANPVLLQRQAQQFPEIRFVIPHLGSGLLRELLMLADISPNVYTDTSGLDGWVRYLPGRITRYDCLAQVLEVLGPRRVLFGSDSSFFPRGWRHDVFEQQLELFSRVGLNADEIALILGGNLTTLIGQSD